jgi:hypothetical protein
MTAQGYQAHVGFSLDQPPEDYGAGPVFTVRQMRSYARAALAAAPVPAHDPADTVQLVGVKDGVETVIGTATMSPRMKAQDLVREMFGAWEHDDGSDADMAFAVCEQLIKWMPLNPPVFNVQAPAVAPESIKWTLNGDTTCCYSNWLGETPFGRILITWKGWKEHDDATVDEFPGGFSAYGNPDEVKAACEAEYQRRAGAVCHPPVQHLGDA